jgi:thymidylate synthase (FAD)
MDANHVILEFVGGSESLIINAARVSTTSRMVTNSDLSEDDIRLLRYLQEHNHGTPFEHVTLRFRVIAPIFVMRQWMRHRIGTFNEYSQRYRQPMLDFPVYTPPDMPDEIRDEYNALVKASTEFYKKWYNGCKQEKGNSRLREMLRCAMPVSTYTEVVWTVNLRSLMNFLTQRCDKHAQLEIRQYADYIKGLIQPLFPHITF